MYSGLAVQSSGLIQHVFRLLQRAKDADRPVPWILLENVRSSHTWHISTPVCQSAMISTEHTVLAGTCEALSSQQLSPLGKGTWDVQSQRVTENSISIELHSQTVHRWRLY